MAIFAEATENECINNRYPLVRGDNLTATAFVQFVSFCLRAPGYGLTL